MGHSMYGTSEGAPTKVPVEDLLGNEYTIMISRREYRIFIGYGIIHWFQIIYY